MSPKPAPLTLLAVISAGQQATLAEVTGALGLGLETVESAGACLDLLGGSKPRVVLVSLAAEGVDAAFLEEVEDLLSDEQEFLISTPEVSLSKAILARQVAGGFLLREPIDGEVLLRELRRVIATRSGVPVQPRPGPGSGIVGTSAAVAEIVQGVAEVGPTEASVLLQGEPGTEKELVAAALHRISPRKTARLVVVNCAGLPEHFLEAELFGREGADPPGRVGATMGRLERARGGTLFLDEVDALSPILQVRLLNALRDGEFERMGGTELIPLESRIIVGSNRDLEEAVRAGEFREDLFDRVASIRIHLPPLRERTEDIVPLAVHFAGEFATRYERDLEGIGHEAVGHLQTHLWPGNVRELRNTMERAVLRSRSKWILAEDLTIGAAPPRLAIRGDVDAGYPPTRSLDEVERDHIRKVLRFTDGVIGAAADILGIHRNTLTRKADQYGLKEGEG